MRAALRYCLQAVFLSLWVLLTFGGMGLLGPEPAEATPAVAVVALGEGSCDEESGDEADELVNCEIELLAARAGFAGLQVSRERCSALLDELFGGLACRPGEADCQRVLPANSAPDQLPSTSTPAGAVLAARGDEPSQPARACGERFDGGHPPRSLASAPPVPPPRLALA